MKKRVFVIIIVIFGILFLCYNFLYYPLSKNETDEKFYISAKNKMIYSDKTISVKEPNNNKFDLFYDAQKKQYECNSVAKIDDGIVYSNDNGIYIENDNGVITEIENPNVYKFIVAKDNIYFIDKTSNLLIYDLNKKDLIEKPFDYGEIEWMGINGDKIFMMGRLCEDDNIPNNVIEKYGNKIMVLFSIDINSLELLDVFYFKKETGFNVITPLLVGNKLFYVSTNTSTDLSTVFLVDFHDNESKFIFRQKYITNIVSNSKDIFFSVEKAKYIPFKIPDSDYKYSNGLWIYNIDSDKKVKILDDSVYEDLLATDNYLYCYKVKYIFPRSTLENINLGYSIEKIQIN